MPVSSGKDRPALLDVKGSVLRVSFRRSSMRTNREAAKPFMEKKKSISFTAMSPMSVRKDMSLMNDSSPRIYIPPYSFHLNIAETLWRIMKGK
jgi:transposase